MFRFGQNLGALCYSAYGRIETTGCLKTKLSIFFMNVNISLSTMTHKLKVESVKLLSPRQQWDKKFSKLYSVDKVIMLEATKSLS